MALLVGGQTTSLLGSQFTALALPTIAILSLRATPEVIGYLAVARMMPYLALGPVAGLVADRWGGRRVMALSDFGRGLNVAAVSVAFMLHHLALSQLYVAMAISGVLSVCFDAALQAYVPHIASGPTLMRFNARLEMGSSSARTAGPLLAGVGIQIVGVGGAMLGDALSYGVSAASVLGLRRERRADAVRLNATVGAQLAAGYRFVLGHPVLRRIAACSTTYNFALGMASSVYLIYVYGRLHVSVIVVGVLFAAGGTAGVVGAAMAPRINRRFGLQLVLVASITGSGAAALLVPMASLGAPTLVLIAASALQSYGGTVYNLAQATFRQAVTPIHLQGRVGVTMRTLVWAATPLGSLIGGLASEWLGLSTVLIISGGLAILSAGWLRAMRYSADQPSRS